VSCSFFVLHRAVCVCVCVRVCACVCGRGRPGGRYLVPPLFPCVTCAQPVRVCLDRVSALRSAKLVILWDLDETLIVLDTLVSGQYARRTGKVEGAGVDLGTQMEDFVYATLDKAMCVEGRGRGLLKGAVTPCVCGAACSESLRRALRLRRVAGTNPQTCRTPHPRESLPPRTPHPLPHHLGTHLPTPKHACAHAGPLQVLRRH
jgi:hypothetical protein